ncbi:MAG: ion channel [Opitutales bacterium]|jgi:voltage-gated potassium channel
MNGNPPKYPMLLAFKKKLEWPMLFLSFVWLCILFIEIVYDRSTVLSDFGTGIWILFIVYFAMRLAIVANRTAFLKKNWLFVLAIVVSTLRFFPFLQPFPLVRALTATFGMQVIWIFASADQGMRFLRGALGRRGSGYALVLTFVVIFGGAAGMLHFEKNSTDPQSIQSYPKAVWWTAMQITNIGSAYSIKTNGGRVICLGISVYAAAMFGYLTALFATFLIDREAKDPKPEIAHQMALQGIKDEIASLRRLIEDRHAFHADVLLAAAIPKLKHNDTKEPTHSK